ncbi:hypothetical protein SBA2_30049 [Acidobacteriia bacterium SbA2]|nr:hypothetical protein SBA2_30049 [Acidobacteriia bacterium SbA2]
MTKYCKTRIRLKIAYHSTTLSFKLLITEIHFRGNSTGVPPAAFTRPWRSTQEVRRFPAPR